jgi:hypothetical protein
MAAFVLGNGVSRRPIDINLLKSRGEVYACNAVYRTHTVTALVATDRPIATEIQASGYAQNNRFYTRRPEPKTGALRVPQAYFGYSSGPIAAALACGDGHARIYLLGFDLGPNETGRFNNIYADTEHYKPLGSAPTFTGNWIKQLQKISSDFPEVRFMRVHGQTTADVAQFDALPAWEKLDMIEFVRRINNPKDL